MNPLLVPRITDMSLQLLVESSIQETSAIRSPSVGTYLFRQASFTYKSIRKYSLDRIEVGLEGDGSDVLE